MGIHTRIDSPGICDRTSAHRQVRRTHPRARARNSTSPNARLTLQASDNIFFFISRIPTAPRDISAHSANRANMQPGRRRGRSARPPPTCRFRRDAARGAPDEHSAHGAERPDSITTARAALHRDSVRRRARRRARCPGASDASSRAQRDGRGPLRSAGRLAQQAPNGDRAANGEGTYCSGPMLTSSSRSFCARRGGWLRGQ